MECANLFETVGNHPQKSKNLREENFPQEKIAFEMNEQIFIIKIIFYFCGSIKKFYQ